MNQVFETVRKYFADDNQVLNVVANLALEEAYRDLAWGKKGLEQEWRAKQLNKSEREKIFLESGVTFGEAFESRRAYLEDQLKEKSKILFEWRTYNEKYPEFAFDLSDHERALKKAKNDYDWHLKLNKGNETLNVEWVKQNRKVGDFVQLNRYGFAKCPLHNERTPSFKANKEESLWHCFGCDEGGSVIDLAMKLKNLNFVEAVKFLS